MCLHTSIRRGYNTHRMMKKKVVAVADAVVAKAAVAAKKVSRVPQSE